MAESVSDTGDINDWRSIVTLIVFIITNLIVLFPFHISILVPWPISDGFIKILATARIISLERKRRYFEKHDRSRSVKSRFLRLQFPLGIVTGPLIADLFLLAIRAIGRDEVKGGTVGADHISPIDIMAFFITLAYIAISLDASGLIRYLAFRVLKWGGKYGHRLFFYLYTFFFGLGSFIGNDPIILSGTAFLAYMTRVSKNIVHPRAWIYTQFAVANISSAILVSSNPTNLVLAGAFQIKFVDYTANMIVPAVLTAIFLFPFLLYIIFHDTALIPETIDIHDLPEAAKAKKPINPNIPYARNKVEEQENNEEIGTNDRQIQLLSLEEIMNPFIDHWGAAFGAIVMAATLITLLALNASHQGGGEPQPVYWVTLPAAFIMFCWDVAFGWWHRKETREIAREGRRELENIRAQHALERAPQEEREERLLQPEKNLSGPKALFNTDTEFTRTTWAKNEFKQDTAHATGSANPAAHSESTLFEPNSNSTELETFKFVTAAAAWSSNGERPTTSREKDQAIAEENKSENIEEIRSKKCQEEGQPVDLKPTSVECLLERTYTWLQETFPTATAVMAHLPWPLIPFALAMFILVQALKTKGWVKVFAHGWDHWVQKTGTVGSVGGMGFLSVVLCNFAGTNIGTTILLSRIIQVWREIRYEAFVENGVPMISNRDFWATVYTMALGVNYGAFSTAFSASLAGLLWRDILGKKHIHLPRRDFAKVNLPIIAIAMMIGCTVLVGEVYIMRGTEPLRWEP